MVVVDVEVAVAVVVFEVGPLSWRIAHRTPTPTATRAKRAMMTMTGFDLTQLETLVHTEDLSADTGVTWYDRVEKGEQHEERTSGLGSL